MANSEQLLKSLMDALIKEGKLSVGQSLNLNFSLPAKDAFIEAKTIEKKDDKIIEESTIVQSEVQLSSILIQQTDNPQKNIPNQEDKAQKNSSLDNERETKIQVQRTQEIVQQQLIQQASAKNFQDSKQNIVELEISESIEKFSSISSFQSDSNGASNNVDNNEGNEGLEKLKNLDLTAINFNQTDSSNTLGQIFSTIDYKALRQEIDSDNANKKSISNEEKQKNEVKETKNFSGLELPVAQSNSDDVFSPQKPMLLDTNNHLLNFKKENLLLTDSSKTSPSKEQSKNLLTDEDIQKLKSLNSFLLQDQKKNNSMQQELNSGINSNFLISNYISSIGTLPSNKNLEEKGTNLQQIYFNQLLKQGNNNNNNNNCLNITSNSYLGNRESTPISLESNNINFSYNGENTPSIPTSNNRLDQISSPMNDLNQQSSYLKGAKMTSQSVNQQWEETKMEQSNIKELNELGVKLSDSQIELIKSFINKQSQEMAQEIVSQQSSTTNRTNLSYQTISYLTCNDPIKKFFSKDMARDKGQNKWGGGNTVGGGGGGGEATDVDFVYLFSQPLVLTGGFQEKQPWKEEVDYIKEGEILRDILNQSGKNIRFMKSVAFVQRFAQILNRNPIAIHFCGHGQSSENSAKSDYLVFENQNGQPHHVPSTELALLIADRVTRPISFVFVASCHSKEIGNMFLKTRKANHVVCVSRQYKIQDEVCKAFARNFYHACIIGHKTICQAFSIAKRDTRVEGLDGHFPLSQELKFEILIHDGFGGIQYDHVCNSYIDAKQFNSGGLIDLSGLNVNSDLPARVEYFMGRQIEMHEILCLLHQYRFITIKGVPGIGQSSLVQEIAHFISLRNFFKDGVFYIQMGGCQSVEEFVNRLEISLHSKASSSKVLLKSKNEKIGEMISQVYRQFKDQNVLILFDNCDYMIASNEFQAFQQFLSTLFSNCPKVKIIATAREGFGYKYGICSEKIYVLQNLNQLESHDLFIRQSARMIGSDEIQELFQKYPKSQVFVSTNSHTANLSVQKTLNQFAKENPQHLLNHQLFDILNGHPQAITISAGLLTQDRPLPELFSLLSHHYVNDETHIQEYWRGFSQEEQFAMKSMFNIFELSYFDLKQQDQQASRMFCFMGLLPAGAYLVDLQDIWENINKEFQKSLNKLSRSSLINQSVKNNQTSVYFYLYPHLIKYAESQLTKEDRYFFNKKITSFFSKQLQSLYNSSLSGVNDEFLREEPNIRAVIFRELYEIGEKRYLEHMYNTLSFSKINQKELGQVKPIIELPLTKNTLKSIERKQRYETEHHIYDKKIEESLSSQTTSGQNNKEYLDDKFDFQVSDEYISVNDENHNTGNMMILNDQLKQASQELLFLKALNDQSQNSSPNLVNALDIAKQPQPMKSFQVNALITFDLNLTNVVSCPTQFDVNNSENPIIFEDLNNRYSLPTTDQHQTANQQENSQRDYEILNEQLQKQKANKNTDQGQTTEYLSNQNSNTVSQASLSNTQAIQNNNAISKPVVAPGTKKDNKSTFTDKGKISTSSASTSNSTILQKTKNSPATSASVYSATSQIQLKRMDKQEHLRTMGKMLIFYCTQVFLMKRYNECPQIIKLVRQIANSYRMTVILANLLRIEAAIYYIKQQFDQSILKFKEAKDKFRECGCSLGVAISLAGEGYMKYMQGDYNGSKTALEQSNKYYDNLNHVFGIHYTLRWLGNANYKINKKMTEKKKRDEIAINTLEKLKRNSNMASEIPSNKHQGGLFVLRVIGDAISIFMETAFIIDLKPAAPKTSKSSLPSSTTQTLSKLASLSNSLNSSFLSSSSNNNNNNNFGIDQIISPQPGSGSGVVNKKTRSSLSHVSSSTPSALSSSDNMSGEFLVDQNFINQALSRIEEDQDNLSDSSEKFEKKEKAIKPHVNNNQPNFHQLQSDPYQESNHQTSTTTGATSAGPNFNKYEKTDKIKYNPNVSILNKDLLKQSPKKDEGIQTQRQKSYEESKHNLHDLAQSTSFLNQKEQHKIEQNQNSANFNSSFQSSATSASAHTQKSSETEVDSQSQASSILTNLSTLSSQPPVAPPKKDKHNQIGVMPCQAKSKAVATNSNEQAQKSQYTYNNNSMIVNSNQTVANNGNSILNQDQTKDVSAIKDLQKNSQSKIKKDSPNTTVEDAVIANFPSLQMQKQRSINQGQ